MKKLKYLFLNCILLFILTGCNATEAINAIDQDLGTNLGEFTSSVEEYAENNTNITFETLAEKAMDSLNQDVNENIESEPIVTGDNYSVHFIDVGQADCTLIICDNEAMLIDCGNDSDGTKIQNYLNKQNISSLKYIIGTHPDSDHIGGMDVILTKFDCETVIMPEYEKDTKAYRDVKDTMKYLSVENTTPNIGDRYTLGSSNFIILAPNHYDYGDESNNYSVAILLSYGNNKFLFTGDAEAEAESDMLNNGYSLKADVYQVGHHGSSSSTSESFLQAVNPSAAVISCGQNNDYGHPHQATLNKLRTAGIDVYRTDEQGTIIAISDGNKITWNCSPSISWQGGR